MRCAAVFTAMLALLWIAPPAHAGFRKPSVLIVHSEPSAAWVSDVQNKLLSSGQFTLVGTFGANTGTPSLAQLLTYDAVLLFSDSIFADPTTLGNNLADYVDAGGGVVNMVFSTTIYSFPAGRWPQNYFSMVGGAADTAGAASLDLASITDQNHPILIGVRSFSGGTSSYRANQNNVMAGATVVARWTGGNVLASAGPLPGRADLNFFPPSSDSRSDLWAANTDGLKLMVNALLYTIRPRVLIAGAEADATWIADVRIKIRGTGVVGIAETFNIALGTPTLAQLSGYDAVLFWTNFAPQNAVALGNVLADYVDAGGGVVAAPLAQHVTVRPSGRWAGEYELITPSSSLVTGSASLGIMPYSFHPVSKNVSTFQGGTSSFRMSGSALNPGAFSTILWSDSRPLVVASTKRHNRLDLGFYPPSSTVRADFWSAATNGAYLMANALNYTVKPYLGVIAADDEIAEPAYRLFQTRRFSAIVGYTAHMTTPTAAQLQQHNGLLIWSFLGLLDAVTIGNTAANFVDAGGGAVVAEFANVDYSFPGGRWQSDGFEIVPSPLPAYSIGLSHEYLGAALEPAHPVNSFVRSFDGGNGSYRATSNPLLRGREILRWSDGRMLAAVHNSKKRVDLGFYPVSSAGPLGNGAWNQRTDGIWLMANAIEYAIRHKPCPGDLNGDGQVDDSDFVMFAGYYDALVDPRGDLNGDGLTEDNDFVIFASSYDALVCP
ncbi:MAG: hypothetical protein JNM86_08545 [Phycisphaerae bacterium]|nr:hypothetical protein [Phycisphaerae bacterium]